MSSASPGTVFNLLDTPGHRDFSEDTLRLAAVDCAVMLLDAARGVEPQTEQLFQVARARRIPLMAFVNKYDRPGMEPLAEVLADPVSSDVLVRADGTRLAVFPNRFVLARFAERHPGVRLARLIAGRFDGPT